MKKSGQPTYWLGLISLFWSLHVHAQYVVNECQWVYDTMVIIEPELQVEAVGSLVNQAVIIYAGVTSIVNNGGFSEKGDLSSCAASYDLPCAASAGSQGLNVFNTAQAATSMSGNSPLRMHSVLLARNISLATEWQIVQSLNWQSGLVTTDRSEPSQQLHWLGGSVSGAAASRHVNGYAAWSGNGSFVLPIGNGSKMQPVALVGNASCTRFSAAYFSGSPGGASLPAGAPFSTTALESGLSGVSPLEYWDINGSSATTVTLYFDAASSLGTYVSDLSQLVVAGWNGSQWVSLGNTAATGSLTGSGTITSASFTPDDYEAYSFGFVGTSTCAEPTALTTVGTTAGSAQIRWTAGSTPTNRSWEVTIGNPSIAGCSASGSGIIRTTVSYVNNVVSFSAPVTAMSVSGSQISITVGGLQADTDYAFYVAEICDTATPPNSVSACVGPATFSTKDAQYAVTTGTITRPGCPFISPGYAANGAFQVIVSNVATCTGTYRVVAAPVPGSGPSGSTPPATTVTTYIGFGAGTFNFSSAGSGSYLVTVTETGPCNPDSDPVTLTVVVPNGVDSSAPIFYVIDEIGNVILDNDPTSPAGITANYGNISLPEGSCSIRRTYYVYGNDGCEGLISSYNAVTATSSVVPATVSPTAQVSVSADGIGYYAVEVNWSVGQNTIQIFGRDVSGNIAGGAAGLRMIANVLDNTDPVVTIMGNSQFTIPVCASSVSGVLTVQVDDLCDQNVNFGSLSVSFGGAVGTLSFTNNNYHEYLVTFPAAGSYLISASYTDANGNVGFVDRLVTVQQAAANQPPVIYAFAESINTPSCADGLPITYSFMITDDCEDIDISQVVFDGGSSGLSAADGFSFVENQGNRICYFEVSGQVGSGDHYITISYQGRTVTRLLRVVSSPDQVGPQVYYPEEGIHVTVETCDGLPVEVPIELAAEDNCGGEVSLALSLPTGLPGATLTATATGYAVVVTEEGSYPLTVVATDGNGNSTVRSFVLLVDQSIPAELACIELVEVEIPGGTTLPFTAADLLTGDFGCLSSDLFAVQILDNNTANGHILDGSGLFPYRVSLVQPQPVNGFTGDFAANEWSVSSTSFGGSTVITEGLLTLTGPANTYCVGGAQVQASIAMPRSGMLSFNYQWQNADPGWDSLRLSVGSEVLQFTAAANLQASFSRQLAAGEVLNLSIRSADCAMGGGLLQLSNWLFVPDNPAEDIDFSQCSGYIAAESGEPADVICPPAMEICINNELVPLDILETVPPSATERSVFTGPGVEAFDLASGLYNFLPAVAGVGEHTIVYSYTYLNGQTDNCSFTVNVLPAPAPVIAGNLVYCGGESMLTASGGFAFYEWNTGDMTQSISISPTESTLYEVVVSDAAGCIGSAAVTVTLSEAPTAAISGDLVLCTGESSQLTGSGGLTYTWSTGETSAQIEVSPAITQTYTLSITDEFGCSDIAEVTVTVNPLPQLSVSGDNLACTGGSTITASGSDLTYLWSTGETSASILANISGTNTYAVTATDVNGCSNTTSYVVTVGDFVAPTITCPTSQSVILPAGICTYQPTGSSWDPMVEDNCSYSDPVYTLSGATIGSGQGSLAAAVFNAGSTTVSWVVNDDAGNIANCSFTVDLLDQTAPNLVCRPSNTITFNGEQTLALSAAALVTTATETCGDVSLSTSLSSLSCAQLGQTLTVTVTATDEAGNSSSCQTLITVAGLPCGWTAPASGINCQGESSVTYNPATAVYTLYSDECQNTPPTNLDELTYAYYRLCGARSYIEARIDNITGVGFAGIVFRESTSPGARKVQHMMSETRNIIRRELRTTTNGSVSGLSLVRNDSRWLKLWRRDNQIIGYVSSTSPSSFTQLYTINMTFTSCVDVGLVLQQTTTAPIEAQFSGVSTMLQSLLPGEAELGSSYEPNAGNMEQNVFPNPTDGVIWLDLSSFLDEAIEIELLDLYSRSIRRQSIGQLDDGLFSVDLSDYASGIYLVKITDSSGIVHTGRVVLQR